MNKQGKVLMVRDGVERWYSPTQIQMREPEKYGWVRVPESVQKQGAIAPEKTEPVEPAIPETPSTAPEPEPKIEPETQAGDAGAVAAVERSNSREFKTSEANAITELLSGKSQEEVEAFFDGEERQVMLALKAKVLKPTEA